MFGSTSFLVSSNNGGNSNVDLFDRFNDLTSFTAMVSRLMVTEIRRRASNKTTQEASETIIKFLEMPKLESQGKRLSPSSGFDLSNNNSRDNSQKGWTLLSTLNLLVCNGSVSLIPVMASNSLPSTLIKCLYLFFDLPHFNDDSQVSSYCKSPHTESQKNVNYSNDYCQALSSSERRMVLERVFAQLLTRLCSHQSSVHELTRKDDLALLFNAVTSWCVSYNTVWRKTAANVILMMGRSNCINALYLHEKGCIASCLENISRMNELSKASDYEITEMIAVLINFIISLINCNISSSSLLLDDFKTNLGYHFIVDFVLRLESKIDDNLDNIKSIISLVTLFSKSGTSELKPRPLSVNQLFIMNEFYMPKPNFKQSIKNLYSFNVLQSLWFKSQTRQVHELTLSALFSLYRDDRANYFILDSQNTLSQFAEKLHLKHTSIQQNFFTLLEYVIYELRYVPCKELISVSIILKSNP